MLLVGLILFFVCFYGLYFNRTYTKFTDIMYLCGIALSMFLILLWLFDLVLKGV